jgi:hypothetical protein
VNRASSTALGCLLSLVLSTGCSNDTGPTAGILNMTFSTQHANEGAVLLIVSGGPVDSIESLGYPIYSGRTGGDTLKLIITGQLSSGVLARIHIPDSRQSAAYGARVAQVAARGTYRLQDLAGYEVTLKP